MQSGGFVYMQVVGVRGDGRELGVIRRGGLR